jgi:hypothetical protein
MIFGVFGLFISGFARLLIRSHTDVASEREKEEEEQSIENRGKLAGACSSGTGNCSFLKTLALAPFAR